MDLEEWLNKRIKDLQEGSCNSFAVDKILAYREILDKLPELEHEVTLREMKEECGSHFGKDCKECPMHRLAIDCLVFNVPTRWKLNEIQKRMREAGK